MSIRPVDFNGMLQRTDDISHIKQNEDAKPLFDQQNIQVQVDKRQDELSHVVQDSTESEHLKNDLDAKDEGRGAYSGSKNKKKEKQKEADGKIIKKSSGGFDVKI